MRIALATSGMWQLKDAIEAMVGGTARQLPRLGFGVDAVAGWGHKPTALKAREFARKHSLPYVAFEDGFLRSVLPGGSEKPVALVMDRTGIYYDARQPSDLEMFVRRRVRSGDSCRRAKKSIDFLRSTRLSKYNSSTIFDIDVLGLKTTDRSDRILVVDQTKGDASVEGALADQARFEVMLETAAVENPGAEILVRVHPETMMGRKAGHFGATQLADIAQKRSRLSRVMEAGLLRLTPEPINPWVLLEAVAGVYCVSSQLGFEALLAECEVHCFGVPFYNGWGLTHDRSSQVPKRRNIKARIEHIFSAVYFDYMRYFSFESGRLIEFEEGVEKLINRRSTFLARNNQF